MGMKEMTGYCGYCHQSRFVRVPDSQEWTQEELDRIATDECECIQAEKARDRATRISRAKLYIDNIVTPNHVDIKQLLSGAVTLILDHKVKKCSVNIDGSTVYTVYKGSDSAIMVQRSEKIVNETEIE